ncbi:hypothetical protein BC939DRAFT_460455 [Gamsiella multidivaricata]|uniref:uncharacterized protein n=1 Tax=Gamsiella multidivaricata TaxID=101098 RepID=UPI00221EC66B|nr:uncharacterized protein BC939DRAFT_460455 [Gamsiella multidivaricata]KAI7819331.1 hypothetical protein BC939DRAFT_460455 [Gamsiella multidivaricata]
MATSKRKSMVDTSDFSKRAKLWFTEGLDGLSSYLKLKPLDVLAIEQQRKKRDWVGAYPGLSDPKDGYYVRGVLLKYDADQEQLTQGRLGAAPTPYFPRNGPDALVEEGKPYQLGPYTKIPAFTIPDFRERPPTRSRSPPSAYGRPSQSYRTPSPSDESTYQPLAYRTQHSQSSSRLGGLFHNRYEQSSLLRARPRIYASKAQRTTSLLQSKYNKDESIARQRLFERHSQSHLKPEQNRLKAALDATIGALRSDRESYAGSRKSSTPSIEEQVAEQRRIRAYNQSSDKEDWDFERNIVPRQAAWLRTKYQGDKEPTWLRNVRNLINRNLPSIEQQPKPQNYQAIVNKHELIEKEVI